MARFAGLFLDSGEKTMPKRIPNHTVIVQRKGVAVQPKIGQPFDFTADEIAQLNKLNPEALSTLPEAKDPETGEAQLTLTQNDLDSQIALAVEKDRAEFEANLRKQIAEEQKAGDNKPAAPVESDNKPEPDVKTVKDTGGKPAGGKAATQAKGDAGADDDI